MIETKPALHLDGRSSVVYRIGKANGVIVFADSEAADLFAAAPRVLAERDALRKALVDVMRGVHPVAVACYCANIQSRQRPCVYCRARKALAGGTK